MIFKKKTSGFTLIELLVVVGIVAVLSSIVFARVAETRGKTRDTVRAEDLKTLQQTIEVFIVEKGRLPIDISEITNFFKVNIKDPLASSGRSYLYAVITNSDGTKSYCLGTRMEVRIMSTSFRPCTIDVPYRANYLIKGP